MKAEYESDYICASPSVVNSVISVLTVYSHIEFVQTSCGYAVPEMKFVSQRETLTRWAEGKGDDGLVEYRQMHNRVSLDALGTPVTDPSE
jgi:hypothetical protein